MRIFKTIGLVIVAALVSVFCIVVYPIAWLASRIVGVPYHILRFFETSTEVFFIGLAKAYKEAKAKKEDEIKTLAEIGK